MLKTRIITAVFLLAGLGGALFFLPRVAWIALCALICAAAAWEWGGLAGWCGKARVAYAAALGVLFFVPAQQQWGWSEEVIHVGVDPAHAMFFWVLALPAVAFWVLVAPLWLKYKWPLRVWRAALVGGVVLLPPLFMFAFLRDIHPVAVLLAAAPVWIADIAAYFSGRAFGRTKLAPSISPGKTWAGAFGAALGVMAYCGIVFTVAVSGNESFPVGAFAVTLVLSVGLTALSIVGDLFESLLKRQAGVKDSSNLLPGHGGILDRIDSLTSALPALSASIFIFVFIIFG
ncbi:MAG: phosphatidate cytidylyltransferase [Azoarcus sp.]|jgi:phosphatidate cytidylyltransferase|nr:phosphatidate cytidylyltransferase [Azoarcus sp.]